MLQESCAQPEITILHLGGGLSSCRRNSKILFCISLEEEPGLCPKGALLFLTAPPLFLHCLPSPISNCLNLPFGNQGRSRRLSEAYLLETGCRRAFVPRRAPQSPAWFQLLLKNPFIKLLYHVSLIHWFFYIPIHLFIYLFMATLGLRCCSRAFSSCSKRGLLFVVVHGLLTAVASLAVEHGL